MSDKSVLSEGGAMLREIFKAGNTVEDDDGLFYFETDYLPLKCNPDYLKLMKTLAVLCAQRAKISQHSPETKQLEIDQDVARYLVYSTTTCVEPAQRPGHSCAHPMRFNFSAEPWEEYQGVPFMQGENKMNVIMLDIDKLEDMKQRVYQDPDSVKNEIFRGDAPYIHRIDIQKVPEIDWTKYRTDLPSGSNKSLRKTKTESLKPSTASVKSEDSPGSDGKQVKVRGRVFHEKKPETFNQLWTVEEQLRLEALLVQFPPEPVENRRWKKIAEALGNRTTKQVCSRVQKYFRKLQKAGLKESSKFTASGGSSSVSGKPAHVHRRHKHLLYKPTTFFPGAAMGELESDSDEGTSTYNANEQSDLSHWVKILEKIAEDKKIKEEGGGPRVSHFGYKCGSCGECPIIGLRWECRGCPTYSSCCDCMAAMMEKTPPPHPITHQFKAHVEYLNPHYANDALGTNNYLDPNFD